ncbi:MAG TPA: ABC transporter substrate-binding protein [Candidatus Limnocylindrales bacterium]|jgi:peptide/nickel transport system substrate-binding protein
MKRTRFGALLIGAGLLLAACTGGSASPTPGGEPSAPPASGEPTVAPSEAAQPKPGGVLVAAIPGDISRTDPALIDDANSSYVMTQVMEGLVGLAPGSATKIIPILATALPTISSDALTYTFTLREGVTFHDGTPFDCDAAKFNYDRWLNIPDSYSKLEYTYYIDTVVKPNIASVACNSPTELAITLTAPNSAFLLTQTLIVFAMSSPTALTEGLASDPDYAKNTYAQGGPTAMTGTGPFKFAEWIPGDRVTLEKNADYWNTDAVAYLDGVVFRAIADSTATLNALEGDEIQLTQTISPIDAATAKENENLTVVDRGGSCNLFHLAMNSLQKPFDNPKIREAVAHAINKQALIDTFYGGEAVAAHNWMPPGAFADKDLALPEYDPEKAKALIAESGVTDLSFEFWYPSDVSRPYMPDPKGEFESILADLEAVGFKPTPKTATWRPDYLSAEAAGKYPIWLIGWNCDWYGPDNFLNTAFFGYRERSDNTFGPNEEYGYDNAAMWTAMTNALTTNDQAAAEQYWQEAMDLIRADLPTVPILSSKPPAVTAAYVKGFLPNPALTEYFNTLWLDQ